jgi:hypothetical protein
MTSVDVRRSLVDALKLDLVGPENGTDLEAEVLSQAPSRWYLTGFLVPLEADEDQKSDETAQDEIDSASGADDDAAPEPPAARRAFFPSSIGLSLLVAKATTAVTLEVHWGDYHAEPEGAPREAGDPPAQESLGHASLHWKRVPRRVPITLPLPQETKKPDEYPVPGGDGGKGHATQSRVNLITGRPSRIATRRSGAREEDCKRNSSR